MLFVFRMVSVVMVSVYMGDVRKMLLEECLEYFVIDMMIVKIFLGYVV